MTNAHDPRTLEERLQWIADWSEPGIDLADAGTAREALERIRAQAIRIRQLEDEYTRRVHADNVEMDALRATIARLSYTLGCIANEDWKAMTADDARREAAAALAGAPQ